MKAVLVSSSKRPIIIAIIHVYIIAAAFISLHDSSGKSSCHAFTLSSLPSSPRTAATTTTISTTCLAAVRKAKRVREKDNRRRRSNSQGGRGRGGSGERRSNSRGGRGGGRGYSTKTRYQGREDEAEQEQGVNTRQYYNYDDFDADDPFGDHDYEYEYYSSSGNQKNDYIDANVDDQGHHQHQHQQQHYQQSYPSLSSSKHFFSKKSLNNPDFSTLESHAAFQQLCQGASISQPSRIQALSWPVLLKGSNCLVADQTGSGKTLAYLIPLLQRMLNKHNDLDDNDDDDDSDDHHIHFNNSQRSRGNGSPQILILAPTAELADQIKVVCDKTTSNYGMVCTRVITATGSHSTNIRDQIRMLTNTKVDVLISTPGRIATILRTKNTSLNLSYLQSIVLDEVDILLIDETFGPQLRTIGAAAPVSAAQFVFVTATLPDEIVESVRREFQNVEIIQGPGLHRIAPNLKEHLVDVSVPSSSNRDLELCFEYKAKELMKALRSNRCKRTLVFCNTVESCRKVENLVRRSDRRSSIWIVGAYHNAMNPEGRRRNLNTFVKGLEGKEGVDHVLVCTDRAARGVDFDSAPVDHVILFDFPKDPAEYVRRVGRTARAGRIGSSTVFAYAWQLPIARKIMGSKLDSFTVAADTFDNNDDEEYTQKQRRQARKLSGEKDKMIRGNIKSGKLWK